MVLPPATLKVDLIVVGAGPAGLFMALNAGSTGKSLLILEKNTTPGKKLLLSGSGQCNLTHTGHIQDFFSHYGNQGDFLKPALLAFDNQALMQFFELSGVRLTENPQGKVFPASGNARDILNCLLEHVVNQKNVQLRLKEPVQKIVFLPGAYPYQVFSDQGIYLSKALAIAAGGSSYPSTGSTGDGYRLAAALGHVIVSPAPALTPVYVQNYPFGSLSGISFPRLNLTLFRKGKKIASHTGAVLLTHQCFSGPGILDFSRFIEKDDELVLSFIPHSPEDFEKDLLKNTQAQGKKLLKTLLLNYDLPERFILKILELTSITKDTLLSQLTKIQRKALAQNLTQSRFMVERLGEWSMAMTTRGGVSLGEINRKTMQSKILNGLYILGETLDIDGDTGGYNLQAAFSTARAAALHFMSH